MTPKRLWRLTIMMAVAFVFNVVSDSLLPNALLAGAFTEPGAFKVCLWLVVDAALGWHCNDIFDYFGILKDHEQE